MLLRLGKDALLQKLGQMLKEQLQLPKQDKEAIALIKRTITEVRQQPRRPPNASR